MKAPRYAIGPQNKSSREYAPSIDVRESWLILAFMPARSSLSVVFRGTEYVGEYEIEGSTLRVFFDGTSKARRIKGSNPEFLARLLLIELISRV